MYVPVGAPLPVGPTGEVAGDPSPPTEPETEEEVGFWGQVGGVFVGAGKGLAEAAVGVKDMAVGSFWMGPAGYLIDSERSEQAWATLGDTAGAVWDDPGLVWDGIKEPYVEAWGRGAYGEAIGRGALEVVLAVVGTKGAGKGATAASRVAGAADDTAGLADDVVAAGDDAASEMGVLVVRDTFWLEDGAALRPDQDPVRVADEYHGDPAASSVRWKGDLAPLKPRAVTTRRRPHPTGCRRQSPRRGR